MQQRLRTEWTKLDHVVTVAAIRQWRRHSSRSVMHVWYTILQYFPHAVINWIQIWRIWRLQLRWDKCWSLSNSAIGYGERYRVRSNNIVGISVKALRIEFSLIVRIHCWSKSNGSHVVSKLRGNNLMRNWSFQVSQGSVETLFSEVEKVYITLQWIYSGNYVPNFIRIARVL